MEHSIRFKVGQTQWKQNVELIKEIDGSYTLTKHAINQRDETDTIRGLTAETIKNMIKAVDLKVKP